MQRWAPLGSWLGVKFADCMQQAAWDFLKTEKPGFDIVTICPPMIYGPLAHTVKKVEDLNQSSARVYGLFVNSSKDAPLPPDALYLYVDPRVSPGASTVSATVS